MALVAPAAVIGHAELVSSNPAANASLVEAPSELTLTFSEPIDPGSARVQLLTARQASVTGVGTVKLDAAGTTATASLPRLDAGTYTVDYQVTSAVDGHVTSGIFAFLVDPTGTEPAPTVPTETASLSSSPEAVAARWLALAGALALAGTAIFWLVSARAALAAVGRAEVAAPVATMAVLAAVALAGLVVHLLLAARPILESDGAAGGWFPLDPAGPFGTTQFAIAMRVALCGLLAALLLIAARRVLRLPERGWLWLVLAATGVGLAGMSFAGHAAATGGPAFAAVDLLHLLGVAAWLGTLVGLFVLAGRVRAAAGPALRRHSRVALVSAPVVILTGVANSPLVLGDEPRELVASGYGNLLLAKAVLFSVGVGIGAANFMLVRRGSRTGVRLTLVAAELVVAGLAVLAAAGLVSGQPAAGRVAVITTSPIGAAHLYGTAGESSVHAAVNLPAPGQQRYQVSVADVATGAYRTDVQRVFLVFDPPAESGLASERVQLEQADEPWLWGATGAYTPLVGDWELEVVVRRPGQLDESTTFPLPVVEPLPPKRVPPPDIGIGIPAPLALAWRLVPAPPLGWLISLALLTMAAGLFAAARRNRSAPLAAARGAAVAVAVLVGLVVGSRALVEAANAPSPAAAAMENPKAAALDSIARGQDLYLANCSACHAADGAGAGPAAEELWVRPGPLSEVVPNRSDGALAFRIAAGTAGTQMPSFADILSENDRWDIVNYLRARWDR